jgi:hypothetical protein
MFMVWLVTLSLISFVSICWYIFQPFSYAMITRSQAFSNQITPGEPAHTLSGVVSTTLLYCSLWWGPLIDLIIIIWALMSAQKRDIESEYYG